MALTNYVLMPGADYQGICDAVRAKTGKTNALKSGELATEIEGITGGGGASGDERVKYVTFMYNGMELIKYPVISGDTCRDPVSKSLIDAPTKESTVQYDYTHNGWSLTEGGSASTSALANVTEDRVVYAAFSSTVRKYTITYYDSDGVTVLKTESLEYGSTPAYMPEKSGYSFNGWTPALEAVTGDVSYQAAWKSEITFANGAWEDIIAISESGEAANTFKLGDTREMECTDTSGNSIVVTLVIAGFSKDDLADGSGKAGMTILTKKIAFVGKMYSSFNTSTSVYKWSESTLRTKLHNVVLQSFPSTLKDGIKAVTKTTIKGPNPNQAVSSGSEKTSDSIWIPSCMEVGYTAIYTTYESSGYVAEGTTYSMGQYSWNHTYNQFEKNESFSNTEAQDQFLTRTAWAHMASAGAWMLDMSHSWTRHYHTHDTGIVFGFCI